MSSRHNMENLNKLILIAGAKGGSNPPPKQHDPYETPEGALYVGYIPKGKGSLYTNEEIEMFQKLEGQYVGLPADDPYQDAAAVALQFEIPSYDPLDKLRFIDGTKYEFQALHGTKPANFSDFYTADTTNLASISADGGKKSAKRAVSVTQIKTLDLIGEGEIEGLSTGEYIFAPKALGQIGYESASFKSNSNVSLNNKNYKYLQSIYYNDISLVDQDGKFNFQQVDVNFTPGEPNPGIQIQDITSEPLQIARRIGEVIRGPNSRAEASGSSNSEVKPYYFSKFYKILNKYCDSVKILIRLDSSYETIQDISKRYEPVDKGKGYGDTIPIQVGFQVSFRRLFANRITENFSIPFKFTIIAKITNGLLYEYRMPFYKTKKDLEDKDFQGYEIKITRITPGSTIRAKSNRTTIDSIVEVYSQKFTYPNTAIISSTFTADYFSSIPKRTYDVKLLKVKIPNNYDPILKNYNGDWDGTFKDEKHWTDNPAWCYYDLLTNSRYGLGKYIKEQDVDKWTLYELSKYCDEMVSDGEGSTEPRYVINAFFTERANAFDALKNFTSLFRGLSYFMAGTIFCTYDSEKTPIYTFSNSNIKGGGFSYQGSSSQSRGNVFMIRYNDKNNFYEPAIEYLEDPLSIKRNGVIEKQISAFGCVKKSYAIRYAEWMKQTENTEIETVSFSAGLEGMLLKPGDVINIQDRNRSSRRLGGKIFDLTNSGSTNVSSVTLDSKILFSGELEYDLSLITPTYNLDASFITTGITSGLTSSDISGIRKPHIQNKTFTNSSVYYVTGEGGEERTKIFFTSAFDENNHIISGRNVFSITCNSTGDSNPPKQFRIINIKEEKPTEYTIAALEYNNEKYRLIDSGIIIPDTSTVAPPAPDEIELENATLSLADGSDINTISYVIYPPAQTKNIVGYSVYAKRGDWIASDFSESQSTLVSNNPPNRTYSISDFNLSEKEKNQATRARSLISESNGTYFFRAYSQNKRGLICEIPASGEILVSESQKLVNLFSISSLVPKDDVFFAEYPKPGTVEQRKTDLTGDGNIGASSKAKKLVKGPNYTELYTNEVINLSSEPHLTWQFGISDLEDKSQNISINDNDISFRITAREPSPNSLPSKYIYFEITGYSSRFASNGAEIKLNEIIIPFHFNNSGIVRDSSFARTDGKYPTVDDYHFPTEVQQKGVNAIFYSKFFPDYFSGNAGPFRNYDIVVEACNSEGYSSVGYSILGAEKITNNRWSPSVSELKNINKGYDIIEIRNPRPAQTICTPSFRFKQAKASIPNSDDADPKKKNAFFNIYNPGNSKNEIYLFSEELSDNYPTCPILGANNSLATFCVTQQYFNTQGDLFLVIKRDAAGFVDPTEMIDYRDALVCVVYYSEKWFNSQNLKERTWSRDADDENVFKSDIYTEHIPKTDKITVPVSATPFDEINMSAEGIFTEYQAIIRARIIDLRRGSSFMEQGQFELKMDITTKKYVSFAFLDEIDASNSKITKSETPDKVIIDDSKNYNISPATLVLVKGEPDSKSGFRAYIKVSLAYTTTSIGNVSGGPSNLVGAVNSYFLKNLTINRGGGYPAYNAVWQGHSAIVLSDITFLWDPISIDIELFTFGVNSDYTYYTPLIYGAGVGLLFTLALTEPVPIESRMVLSLGGGVAQASPSKVNLTENTLSFIIPLNVMVYGNLSASIDLWGNLSASIDRAYGSSPDKFIEQDASFTKLQGGGIHYTEEHGIAMISNGQKDGKYLSQGKFNIIDLPKEKSLI